MTDRQRNELNIIKMKFIFAELFFCDYNIQLELVS